MMDDLGWMICLVLKKLYSYADITVLALQHYAILLNSLPTSTLFLPLISD